MDNSNYRSSSLSVTNWRKYAKDTNGEPCGAFSAASRVEDLLDFALERAERSVLQLKTDRATVNCTGKFFDGSHTEIKCDGKGMVAISCEPSVTNLSPSVSSWSISKNPPIVCDSIVSKKTFSNKKKVFEEPTIPWKAINRQTQAVNSRDSLVRANHIFHVPSKRTKKSSWERITSKTSPVVDLDEESPTMETSKGKPNDKKNKLNIGSRGLPSIRETESSCPSVTTSRASSSAFTPLSTSALNSSAPSPSRQSSQHSRESSQVAGASAFQSAHSTLQPVHAVPNHNDQGFWFNFNVMVKDPRDGTVQPMHFMADCTNFEVKEMFVNGKRLG